MIDIRTNQSEKGNMILKTISFFVNGKRATAVIKPGMTLLDMIHDKLRLTGTKLTCNEGDCGSCTVVIGELKKQNTEDRRIIYRAVNSCIYPAVRIHNKHLITIEGIAEGEELHPIQKGILDFHGSQCGYCTPGFIMSLLGLFINNRKPTDEEILASLEGNLCRCTGYESLMNAARYLRENLDERKLLKQNLRSVEQQLGKIESTIIDKNEDASFPGTHNYYTPLSVEELLIVLAKFQDKNEYRLISGGTDLMVQANINRVFAKNLIDVLAVDELDYIIHYNDEIQIGAATSMEAVQKSKLINKLLPVLVKAVKSIASKQIRNTATFAGNIANASPIADSSTTLLSLNAKLELLSAKGSRIVELKEYFLDYKKTVLETGEFIAKIIIPINQVNQTIYQNFIKSAKRKAVDISSVVSAINLTLKGKKIVNARLAYGGVKAYPALAFATEKFLIGKTIDESWFEEAAKQATEEFIPISDVRGSKEYRSLLIKNHLLTYLNELLATPFSSPLQARGISEVDSSPLQARGINEVDSPHHASKVDNSHHARGVKEVDDSSQSERANKRNTTATEMLEGDER